MRCGLLSLGYKAALSVDELFDVIYTEAAARCVVSVVLCSLEQSFSSVVGWREKPNCAGHIQAGEKDGGWGLAPLPLRS